MRRVSALLFDMLMCWGFCAGAAGFVGEGVAGWEVPFTVSGSVRERLQTFSGTGVLKCPETYPKSKIA